MRWNSFASKGLLGFRPSGYEISGLSPRTNRFWCCTSAFAWLLLGISAYSASDQSKDLAALRQKIDELDQAGKYREAVPVAEEHLKLVESTIGTDRPDTAASCNKLGDLYRKDGDY